MQSVFLLVLGIVLLNAYALALVLLRGPLYRVAVYRPMLLNIGLSLAPAIVMALMFVGMIAVVTWAPVAWLLWMILVLGGLIWLLLLPNAAYLITELNFSHRTKNDPVPLWYDIVAVLSLALSGVMNTIINVLIAQLLAVLLLVDDDQSTPPQELAGPWLVAFVVLLLVSFGIYLGRYIRFNSWDLLHPLRFVKKTLMHFSTSANRLQALGFVLTHVILLSILYYIVAVPALLAIFTGT